MEQAGLAQGRSGQAGEQTPTHQPTNRTGLGVVTRLRPESPRPEASRPGVRTMTTWPFLSHGRGHRTGTVLTQSFRTIFRRLQTSASSPGAICTAGAGGREGTVTCFASETTELTATEKP